MPATSTTQITERDLEIFTILEHLPLTTDQLFRYSKTFLRPFNNLHVLRRRLRRLESGGLLRRYYFAIPSRGSNPCYWRLTRRSHRTLYDGKRVKTKKSLFTSIGVSLHRHTYDVNELMVHLLLDANSPNLYVSQFSVEKSLQIGDTNEHLVPDATLELLTQSGYQYRFYIELDTASERISTLNRLPSSIQRKLLFYERYRAFSNERFRVLFVTTSSQQRKENILRFSDSLSNNRSAKMIYAGFLPEILSSDACLFEPAFKDHRLQPVKLISEASRGTMAKDNVLAHGPVNRQPQLISSLPVQ